MFADRLIPAEPDQRGRRIRIQIRGRRARAAGAQAASGASAQRPAPTCPETRLGSGRPAPALEPPGPQMFASPRAGRDLGAWGPGPRGPGPGHARHPGLDYDCRRGESARRRVGPRARALRTGLAPARVAAVRRDQVPRAEPVRLTGISLLAPAHDSERPHLAPAHRRPPPAPPAPARLAPTSRTRGRAPCLRRLCATRGSESALGRPSPPGPGSGPLLPGVPGRVRTSKDTTYYCY